MDLLNRSIVLHQEEAGAYMDLAVPIRERGRLYLILGRFARAKVDLDQSMALYRKHGSNWFNEVNLNIAGNLYRLEGNYKQAEQLYKRSLAAAQKVNNEKLTAYYLGGLATVVYDQGRYSEAEKHLQQALDVVKKLQNEPEIASILRHLGHVTMAMDRNVCQQYYLQSLQLSAKHWLAPVVLDVLLGVTQLYAQKGRELEAIELLAMVAAHESSTYETKRNAAKSLEALTINDGDDLYAFAESRGQDQDLWAATSRLLSRGL